MEAVTPGADACNYAIVTGILVHGPDDTHYLWQGDVEVVMNGKSMNLQEEVCSASRDAYTPALIRYVALKAEETSLSSQALMAMSLQGSDADPYASMSYASSETPAFREKLDAFFPGALHHEEAAVRATHVLRQPGSPRKQTMAVVAQCRDEICKPFVDAIDANWLVPSASRRSRAPSARASMVSPLPSSTPRRTLTARVGTWCSVASHIAVDAEGNIGKVIRRGARVCRARAAPDRLLRHAAVAQDRHLGDVPRGGVHRAERRLATELTFFGKPPPDLVEAHETLPRRHGRGRAHDHGERRKEEGAGRVRVRDRLRYLIHGPDGSHYFWQGSTEVVAGASVKDLTETVREATRDDYMPTMVRYLKKKPDGDVLCEEAIEQTPFMAEAM